MKFEMNAKNLMSRSALLLLLLFVVSRTPVFGQGVITQDLTFSQYNLGSDTGPPGTTGSKPYNLFNEQLGTLTEVEISLENVVVSGSVNVENGSSSAETYTNITLDGVYTVMDSFGHSVTLSIQSTPPVSLGPINPGANMSTPTISGGPAPTQTTNIFVPNIGGFESPTGVGTTTLTLTSHDQQSVTGTGTFTGTQTSTGVGDVVLTYIYTPVPEPTQTAIWLMGFAVCVLAVRKYFPRRTLCLA